MAQLLIWGRLCKSEIKALVCVLIYNLFNVGIDYLVFLNCLVDTVNINIFYSWFTPKKQNQFEINSV